MNCYICNKEHLETPFCSDECHNKWKEEHPVSPKFSRNIADLQNLVLSWRKHSNPRLAEDMTQEVAEMIFS